MRKDAARNHAAILAVAARLITERGLDFAMDEVAAEAGVGKGTVFRRFGDREGLVRAVAEQGAVLWREESRELAEADHLPAGERVVTFVGTLFDHVMSSLPLIVALERESANATSCDSGYLDSHATLAALLVEAGAGPDADFLAHVLLAQLRGDVLHHLVHRCGQGAARVREGVLEIARGVVAGRRVTSRTAG
ncbi:TetR/AcrR family transcriptional regulator [Umezawaea beigongshangensis]|uniref:TetR/AcrR family transcriptional regulator n=1 Tax=Umezawaea beigongshangensis TaxID=2780383 RepID=UPI0018F19EF2|nr:TetR/AcrR family transcriptional regulator [Umezawaea beigongshangensis]